MNYIRSLKLQVLHVHVIFRRRILFRIHFQRCLEHFRYWCNMDPDGRGVPIDSYLAGNFGQHTSGQIGYPACPNNTYDYGHQMAPNVMSLHNTCSTYTPLQNTGSSSLLYGSLPQHHTDLQYPCSSPQWPMVAPPEPHHQLFATLAGFPNGGVCDMPQTGSDDRGNLSGSDRPKVCKPNVTFDNVKTVVS